MKLSNKPLAVVRECSDAATVNIGPAAVETDDIWTSACSMKQYVVTGQFTLGTSRKV